MDSVLLLRLVFGGVVLSFAAVEDVKDRKVDRKLTLLLMALGVSLDLYQLVDAYSPWLVVLFTGSIAFAFLALWCRRLGFPEGDARLTAGVALLLPYAPAPYVLVVGVAALLAGTWYVTRRLVKNARGVPYAACLLAGFLLVAARAMVIS